MMWDGGVTDNSEYYKIADMVNTLLLENFNSRVLFHKIKDEYVYNRKVLKVPRQFQYNDKVYMRVLQLILFVPVETFENKQELSRIDDTIFGLLGWEGATRSNLTIETEYTCIGLSTYWVYRKYKHYTKKEAPERSL